MQKQNNNEIVLEIKDLNIYYGAIHAVKGINIKVPKGKIITLIGANGAGKTSTLSAIAGLVKPKSGEILYKGNNIAGKSSHEITRMGIALVPEGRRIFPNLTVYENLMMGAYNRKDKEGIERDLEWVYNLFPRLKERLKQLGGTLSGGEQQMLAISRAIMSKPEIIMMDEPSLGLAPVLVSEVFDIIKVINENGGTILLIEQNAAQALRVSHYGYVLETGNIILENDSDLLLKDESVQKAYLGMA
ncbi:amino acid ABC transporter ATPase [Marinitoga sp. 1135]|uniref:ABC-type branched-chain amino acid transport systems, ATPase component n=1 Tax=Marinitoga piezophila (strain DSM 14283 / JCM 11233 / KA3) TaxID=443254 RepID=H2J6B9_MARPK|nr:MULTISPECIES: ABC transporter ATP-binding protein [Marinitoga]AEX86267.1 ABC-type branched-chain amino acid transport systems, ATPase component [Marinitoga piezophila KA3]APT76674.1 amino acid ABC transporter ATPase [Marinitoga sp. 1137]NUU96444.1 amino acid ABC transporter ATPase [Marinitoga sp. 1135]NUU98365.1 amino acid ABC transporter ATPase [Marinitoga sp. 1138]